jgi:flagellar motility protein MotE (MotC chaperone)
MRWFIKVLLLLKVAVIVFYVARHHVTLGEISLFAETQAPKKEEVVAESEIDKWLKPPEFDVESVKKEEMLSYIQLAKKNQEEVAQKIKRLQDEKQQISDMKQSLEKLLAKIDEEKQFFAASIQKEQEIKADRLKNLVIFYEKMEPKKAAPIFETMDKDLAIALISALKNKQTTSILESMQPEQSKQMTEYYGRVGSGREYELLKEMNVSIKEAFSVCEAKTPSPTSSL